MTPKIHCSTQEISLAVSETHVPSQQTRPIISGTTPKRGIKTGVISQNPSFVTSMLRNKALKTLGDPRMCLNHHVIRHQINILSARRKIIQRIDRIDSG